MRDRDNVAGNKVTDVMIINFNVFGSLMIDQICCYIYGNLVVAIKCTRKRM